MIHLDLVLTMVGPQLKRRSMDGCILLWGMADWILSIGFMVAWSLLKISKNSIFGDCTEKVSGVPLFGNVSAHCPCWLWTIMSSLSILPSLSLCARPMDPGSNLYRKTVVWRQLKPAPFSAAYCVCSVHMHAHLVAPRLLRTMARARLAQLPVPFFFGG